MSRIICHLDMDAFFASVEERDKPRFKGLAIVVGSDPKDGKGRGVVSTANYKAREYGIKSATPISIAWKLAKQAETEGKPKTVFITPNFTKYEKTSHSIIEIIRKYSDYVEQSSIDEAYFDLSIAETFTKAETICKKIKAEIKKKEKITASIGMGPNKLIAKIASDFQKPNGLTIIKPEDAEAFLNPLSIRKIPGIGPKTEEFFKKEGIAKIDDLKKFSQKEMVQMLGKWGLDLYKKIYGIDESPITEEYEVKSISEQETLEVDSLDPQELTALIKKLSHQVYRRFSKSDFETFKTVGITVRFQGFETKTRAHTLSEKTNSQTILEFEVLKLLLPFLDKRENPKHKKIRLLGVKIEKLE